MPYKSQAQRGKFHELEKEGKLPKKTVDEFDKASKGKKLPERASKKADPMQPRDMSHLQDNYDRPKRR